MAFNGSGTYTAPSNSWNPAVSGTDISTTDWAALLADLSTAMSTAICKDGQTTTTAVIPFTLGLSTDTIAENTAATGVTIDGVLLKDSQIQSAGANGIVASISGDSTYVFSRAQKTTGIAQSTTTDIFRFLGVDGSTVIGTGIAVGHFYINVVDEASGANNSTYIYAVGTTGNGASNNFLNQLALGASGAANSAVIRGTTLVTGFQIVADGGGGAVKLQLLTAASGKTVTVRVAFQGMVK